MEAAALPAAADLAPITPLVTTYTGFSAAARESARNWPSAAAEIRTGFWGCGAFGNRQLMAPLQLLAARLAGIERLSFCVFDDAGDASFTAGAAALERVLTQAGEPLGDLLSRITGLGCRRGTSDGAAPGPCRQCGHSSCAPPVLSGRAGAPAPLGLAGRSPAKALRAKNRMCVADGRRRR